MSLLIDTNVLLRFFELQDPKNAEIVNAFNPCAVRRSPLSPVPRF